MNILIVDDEALARSRLRTLLADIAPPGPPHQLSEAATAAEALALLAPTSGRAFDVVLLDIHMPGQDGLGLAHTLQTLAYPPALVFVTAHTEHAVSAFELDAVDYLTKPVRRERLPLAQVLYFKAEQKYVTVRTAARSYILDASLNELEARHAPHFLRIHRNALVAQRAVRALEKHYDPEEGEGWAVRLQGLGELLAVSRRQVAAVREALTR